MTYTTQSGAAPQSAIAARFTALADGFRANRARRRVFRQTLTELSMLSDRDLADLGLARSEIRRVAWQAAQDS